MPRNNEFHDPVESRKDDCVNPNVSVDNHFVSPSLSKIHIALENGQVNG